MSGRGATGYDYLRVAEIEAILVDTFRDQGFDIYDDKGHPCAYPPIYDEDGVLIERNGVDLHLARELGARLS